MHTHGTHEKLCLLLTGAKPPEAASSAASAILFVRYLCRRGHKSRVSEPIAHIEFRRTFVLAVYISGKSCVGDLETRIRLRYERNSMS